MAVALSCNDTLSFMSSDHRTLHMPEPPETICRSGLSSGCSASHEELCLLGADTGPPLPSSGPAPTDVL